MAGGVLVAGGTGALGTAVVRVILEDGRRVTATWIVAEERERLEQELGSVPELSLVEADLTDPAAAEAAVAGVEELGAVVDLVGGYTGGRRADETEPEVFERMLRLNLTPAILLARAAIPSFVAAGGGAFVAVSAHAAVNPRPGDAAYSTAKAAVLAFVRALDADYRLDGVRANAILPKIIDTPANRRSMPNADHAKWVAPEEIARVVRFLVSAESAPTSGAAVPVYGRA